MWFLSDINQYLLLEKLNFKKAFTCNFNMQIFKMKQTVSICFLWVTITLISCKSMYFKVPQPLDTDMLNEFPENIRGLYTSADVDTMKIDRFSFVMGNKDSSFEGGGSLNADSVILKKMNNCLVLSIKDEIYWNVLLIKYNNDTLFIFGIDVNDKENYTLNRVGKITPFRTLKNDKGEIVDYLINPSKKQFEQLVDLGLFTEEMTFIRKKT